MYNRCNTQYTLKGTWQRKRYIFLFTIYNFQLLVQIFRIIRDFSSPLLYRLKQGTLCIFGEFKKEMFQISCEGPLRNRISSKNLKHFVAIPLFRHGCHLSINPNKLTELFQQRNHVNSYFLNQIFPEICVTRDYITK
jgi:hypothetical protein